MCVCGVGWGRSDQASDAPPSPRIALEPGWTLALSVLAGDNGQGRGSGNRVWRGRRGEETFPITRYCE